MKGTTYGVGCGNEGYEKRGLTVGEAGINFAGSGNEWNGKWS